MMDQEEMITQEAMGRDPARQRGSTAPPHGCRECYSWTALDNNA